MIIQTLSRFDFIGFFEMFIYREIENRQIKNQSERERMIREFRNETLYFN